MKNNLRLAFFMVLFPILTYICIAFINWEFNPGLWIDASRLVWGIIVGFFWVMILLISIAP